MSDDFLILADYFYVDQNSTPVTYPELALEYQDKVLDFVHGMSIEWPVYGETKQMHNITNVFGNTTLLQPLQERYNILNAAVLDRQNRA